MRKLFTSESVTEGHPDKLCDQISDAILDAILAKDSSARVAVETVVTTGQVHVVGEVTTSAYVDIPKLVRELLIDVGYDNGAKGFDGYSVGINVAIGQQSPDIAQGVDGAEQGAGDQGIMFGYACEETPELMPAPIMYAHALTRRLTEARKSGELPYLRPDGKAQVTVAYVHGRPAEIDTVVLSAQHDPHIAQEQIRDDLERHVIVPVLEKTGLVFSNVKLHINPTGQFIIGGPQGDAGLTGRKIIVDTYGGASRHGGGAFSGKDSSKVDRSAAYAARWIAKHVVAAKLASRCEVQFAYAIGVAQPVAVYVNTFGTTPHQNEDIESAIRKTFDLRPAEIIKQLDLLKPVYLETASGGHFGREQFTWEQTPYVDALLENMPKRVKR